MYEHFNPLQLESAWLQHLLFLLGAGILGYLIGFLKSKNILHHLEAEIRQIEFDLDQCHKGLYVPKPTVRTAGPLPEPIVAPPAEEAVQPFAAVPHEEDDLKKIEGIGPKIEKLLHEAGIKTFAQLAVAEPSHVMSILRAAGSRFQIQDPNTWPRQARLAQEGKWDELRAWQQELQKGKE
ncbi:hypothetical protein BWI97_06730 [Siphonobacter sp. BAB-5405]|uniref:helix-hairpin-helix domain-containing protein n=1 Tax=Siphonobacter sp. BAB-5405 TaxID=1864825 RepID=UPI000C7FD8FB|nr:helix-hairpin-helix domain-containing protein [Siphonobacter sp. BAB-5405]PMD97322.1 hypothetical protein BWI97_06730 [Siphonobacter sp. BAB-5405]